MLGGSLGARVFSDIVPAALAALPEALRARLLVTQQCRAEDLERVRAAYAAAGSALNFAPFFPDVADRLREAHLVIARAGASTVAELAVAGRPAILVPLPGAIDDHQTANASALAERGRRLGHPAAGFHDRCASNARATGSPDPGTRLWRHARLRARMRRPARRCGRGTDRRRRASTRRPSHTWQGLMARLVEVWWAVEFSSDPDRT